MGNHHHAQPLFCQLPEEPAHLQHVGVVQTAGGFVEDQQLLSAEAAVHNGQVLYAVDRITWLHENRDLVGGLRWVEEASSLRFFFGRLESTSDWQEKLVKKFRDDFGDSL